MRTITVTWHSVLDRRRCKVCEALESYTWTFEDELPLFLEHPQFGVVWNIETDQSIAHEFYGGLAIHCRCSLTTEIDVDVDSEDP